MRATSSINVTQAGQVAVLAAVATYYVMLMFVFDPRTDQFALVRAALVWLLIALIAGPIGGVAGALARSGTTVIRIVSRPRVGHLTG